MTAPLAQSADPLEEASRLTAEADRLWPLADWKGAETVLLRALRLREQALGPVHADVAHLIDRVGRTHYNRHDYGLAADWFLEAAEVGERALGPLHLDLAGYLANLGAALRDAGRPEQGEPHVLRALSIRRSLLGPEAQPVGAGLLNLGRNYLRQERFAESRGALLRAADILQSTMGADAPMTSQARGILVAVDNEIRRRWLILANTVGALAAAGLLIGMTLWAETPRRQMPARWIWIGAHMVMLVALLGLYATSFLAAGFYLGPIVLTALDAWGEIPRGLFKLIGLVGVVGAVIALEAMQNGMRWLLGRPFSLTWLPRGRTEPEPQGDPA